MSVLELENITKIYDKRSICGVRDLNFKINKGEIVCLTGPSGSGKTTTLNIICKNTNPDSGLVRVTPKISYIPQFSELAASKSVFENILDGTESQIDEEKKVNLVRLAAQSLELTNELEKLPSEISGGQRQRVIMAKALVSEPELIVMDEPFAHLDSSLRCELIENLWEVFRDKKIALLWVTHEISDALAHSDRIIVLNYGKVQQIGDPETVYQRPANLFVASFLGNANCIAGKIIDDQNIAFLGKCFPYSESLPMNNHSDILIVIRPENLTVDDSGELQGKISRILFFGDHKLLSVKIGDKLLQVKVSANTQYVVGKSIKIKVPDHSIYCIPEI